MDDFFPRANKELIFTVILVNSYVILVDVTTTPVIIVRK